MAMTLQITTDTLADVYRRVRRGVALLDQKVPNWRRTMRKHQDQYNFADGDFCVLGTLEHFNGRLHTLRKRKAESVWSTQDRMTRAQYRLGIDHSSHFGFCWRTGHQDIEGPLLAELWRQEFLQDPPSLERR